jgi:2-keto-4-pentenoate hydratase/2-oxohepta-3-ene-1,7-dioic acid hydratase in catechol pathway
VRLVSSFVKPALELWLKVDGVEKQRGSTGDMLAASYY